MGFDSKKLSEPGGVSPLAWKSAFCFGIFGSLRVVVGCSWTVRGFQSVAGAWQRHMCRGEKSCLDGE